MCCLADANLDSEAEKKLRRRLIDKTLDALRGELVGRGWIRASSKLFADASRKQRHSDIFQLVVACFRRETNPFFFFRYFATMAPDELVCLDSAQRTARLHRLHRVSN